MPRQSRIDFPGALQHVMVRGVARGLIFRDDRDRARCRDELAGQLASGGMQCLAWAWMPNHLHVLVRTGSVPLGRVMLRWLTRYAAGYNRRHRRAGHLFQNRYKSILCEKDPYLLELVRYIHLNPLRAGMVASLQALERYPWSGYAALMGRGHAPWQATGEVLSLLAGRRGAARRALRAFMAEGVRRGHRDDLMGGGLVRSLGHEGLSQASRQVEMREAGDPRILGQGRFVEAVMRKVEAADRRRERVRRRMTPEAVLRAAAKVAGIEAQDFRRPNRRPAAVVARALACRWLVAELGMRGTAVARLLGVTGAAVTQGVARGSRLEQELKVSLDDAT